MAEECERAEQPGTVGALERLRMEIERLDASLIQLLAQRMRCAVEAGRVKRATGLPEADPMREAAVVRNAAALARNEGLPEEDVRDVFWRLIAMSRRLQAELH